ncbi:MAG: pitrilysin family protein [Geobacteraceae bacterium]|nr:pitrilysin family protein [Geobacteraceae bacterium]
MKKLVILLFLLVSSLSAAGAERAVSSDPRTMNFRPLSFEVPKAERQVLGNGMIVYLLEDRELPIVTIQAYVPAGSIYDPPDKAGLALLTGAVLRGGGTSSTSAEKLDDELEFMASSIESGIGPDSGTVSMSCLTKNLDRTLELFSQVMTAPAFREDRVEQGRNRAVEAIRRQNDDPKDLADRELRKAIYTGHPLGRFPTIPSINAITRADLIAFHRRYFHPNGTILAVSGDFDKREMLARLKKAFTGWKREQPDLPAVQQPSPSAKSGVYFVGRDIDQSVIRMGHLGIDKNNPDLYAVTVMNAILGGNGFSSRMMDQIRSREGLAYNAASFFQAGRRFPGTFDAETETKAATTVRTIGLMDEIIRDMTLKPVTGQELSLAKDSIINSFIFAFTNAASVVNHRARLEFYGYPEGYLENYRQNVAKITREDVLRVARKYLRPEGMILVVVGDEKKFDKPLSTLGKVTEIVPDNSK